MQRHIAVRIDQKRIQPVLRDERVRNGGGKLVMEDTVVLAGRKLSERMKEIIREEQ